MSGDRRTAAHRGSSAPTRADARQAIVEEWRRAGWPQPPRSGADYARLQERMIAYLAVVFPEVDHRCRGHIVGRTLSVFMAPLHARRPRQEWPEPEALVTALDDALLDRAEEALPPGRGEDDQRVAMLAFRSTPADVRAGLAALAAEGKASTSTRPDLPVLLKSSRGSGQLP